jgi:hypothetical protein
MVGLCLAAVCALVAVMATSASALPEWGKCTAKAGGKFLDNNCTKKGSVKKPGSFEWTKGSALKNVKFTGANEGAGGVLSTVLRTCETEEGTEHGSGLKTRAKCAEEKGTEIHTGEIKIECEAESNRGEASGTNKIVNILVIFKGCKIFGAVPCSSGGGEGEITVNVLKGTLGYISKSEHKVGVLLEPAKAKGEFAKFNCGGLLVTVVGVGNSKEGANYTPETTGGYDGIISPITPVNQMTSEYTQVFTVNPETTQNIPSKFEGKHISLLEDYAYDPRQPQFGAQWSPAGEEITNVNHPEEEGEIKG